MLLGGGGAMHALPLLLSLTPVWTGPEKRSKTAVSTRGAGPQAGSLGGLPDLECSTQITEH